MKDILQKALDLGKAIAQGPFGLIVRLIKTVIRVIAFSPVALLIGGVVGVLIGARVFETGNFHKQIGLLRGMNVYVTGPCRVDGVQRVPSLAEDEAKIVGVTDKHLIAVLRATRETVECNLDTVAVDPLPLLRNFGKIPMEVPQIRLPEKKEDDSQIKLLMNKTLRLTGICFDTSGMQLPPMADKVVDVINVERGNDDKSVLVITGINKKENLAVKCSSKQIKYDIVDTSTVESAPVVISQPEPVKSLEGQVILVTSTCFPDHRLPAHREREEGGRKKPLFYALVNNRVQVNEAKFDGDKLIYLSGAHLDIGEMIECDNSRFPLSWRSYDPSKMRLEPIRIRDSEAIDGDADAPQDESTGAAKKQAPAGNKASPKK